MALIALIAFTSPARSNSAHYLMQSTHADMLIWGSG